MFNSWFRHKYISKIASEAEAYISQNFVDSTSTPVVDTAPVFEGSTNENEFDLLPPIPEELDVLPEVPLPFQSQEKQKDEIPETVSNEVEEWFSLKENSEIQYSLKEDSEVKYSLKKDNKVKYSLPIRHEREVDVTFSKARATGDYSDLKPVLEKVVNETFVEKVNDYIQEKQLPVTSIYKAAQIDRRLFSKVMADHEYKPSKDTALAIALALHLSLKEAEDLLTRAGYSLSHSSKRDIVIEYCFKKQIYDITDINLVLDKLDMKVIGR